MSYCGCRITDWISSVSYSNRRKQSENVAAAGTGDGETWPDSTQTHTHKATLWTLSCETLHTIEFLHVTGCGLDITVQGHFLKCAPVQPHSPPPIPFPPHPNKKAASVGKVPRPLMSPHGAQKPALLAGETLWSSAYLYTSDRTLQRLSDVMKRPFDVFKITSLKQRANNLAHPNIWVKISTRISKRRSLIALAETNGAVFITTPRPLIWLFGRSGFPRWAPTVWTNSLLSMFQVNFRL